MLAGLSIVGALGCSLRYYTMHKFGWCSIKVRPVDHFSWSHGARERRRTGVKAASINGHDCMPGAVAHAHLDDLLAVLRLNFKLIGILLGLATADIDSAFLRVPLNS